uniref:COG3650 family protein n=1 Tax=uncultured Erythrobacter sp. TaxID=263913 RepID=UPI002630FFF6|nr:hypothetical protein [uncultured Erythrobacter sp.]
MMDKTSKSRLRLPAIAIAASAAVSACASGDSINEGGEIFDSVSAEATINLLGNEPFWGIEIVPEGMGYVATYTTPEDIEGTRAVVTRFAGNNGLGFSGELDDAPLQIALTPGTCNDTMSDNLYPYTATVSWGDQTLMGCGYTSDEPIQEGAVQ